jgi:hypothetical protein
MFNWEPINLQKDDDGKNSCDFCYFPFPIGGLKTFKTTNPLRWEDKDEHEHKLCFICANTLAGNQLDWPDENTPIMKQQSYIGNLILRQIDFDNKT